MAMMNMNSNNILNSVKDSRWLQLEVCREFQRNKCTRSDGECKFAHPSGNVEVINGRVVACYDSIKGRCNREKPPCKYFHPPQHLKDQLLINGRNHLALKNALLQTHMPISMSMSMPHSLQTVLTGQLPMVGPTTILNAYSRPQSLAHHIASQQRAAAVASATATFLNANGVTAANSHNSCGNKATNSPYSHVANLPALASASAYGAYPAVIPGLMSTSEHLTNNYGVVPTTAIMSASQQQQQQQHNKPSRTDRLEVCREFQRGNCKRAEADCRFAHPGEHVQVDPTDGVVTVCMDHLKGRCSRDTGQCRYFHAPSHLQAKLNRPNAASAMSSASASHVLAEASATSLAVVAGKKRARDPSDEYVMNMTFPGVPFSKRPALEKSGQPMYQPSTTAYQQLMHQHQTINPFVPLSYFPYPMAGHHPNLPRY